MTPYKSDDLMAQYMALGSYCFDGSAVLSMYDVNKIIELGPDSEEAKDLTNELAMMLQQCYLSDFKTKIEFDFANKQTYGNIEKWHSDAEYIFPGQNATINCFFDNTSEEVGGRFDITGYDPDLLGTKTEVPGAHSTYPKKYSILVFNQNRTWLHKVVPSTAPRRMLSFAAQFTEFNRVIPNFQ